MKIEIIVLFYLLDYEYSLWGLPEGSKEWSAVKHEVHLRSARKLQDLCFKNGGIYIKLGQHIGQLVCWASFLVLCLVCKSDECSDYKFFTWFFNLMHILDSLWQEYLIPEEYVQTMRESMLNRCPVSSYDQVCEVFKKELGVTPDKVCWVSSWLQLHYICEGFGIIICL